MAVQLILDWLKRMKERDYTRKINEHQNGAENISLKQF